MSIGYACHVIGEENTTVKSCVLKNAGEETLRVLSRENMAALNAMIDYNISAGIRLFRVCSEIIPFGSHPVNALNWQKEFREELAAIGKKIADNSIRVSMHPGQYTVLNSPNVVVVENAIKDLEYHLSFLKALGTGSESKIVLHVGGVYGDKEASTFAFLRRYQSLSPELKSRIVLENDDKNFTVQDVLQISQSINCPVIFDNLHHRLNPSVNGKTETEWIALCEKTWGKDDGKQKVHYSEQKEGGSRGSHSETVSLASFLPFYQILSDKNIDIMLEVKDKNLSALKCINAVNADLAMSTLEEQWARYKYFVLSKSGSIYTEIRSLLQDKAHPNAFSFYELVDAAHALTEDSGAEINAALHIWGYLKDKATEAEKRRFIKLLGEYTRHKGPVSSLKNHLHKCAENQGIDYLIKSYYFYI